MKFDLFIIEFDALEHILFSRVWILKRKNRKYKYNVRAEQGHTRVWLGLGWVGDGVGLGLEWGWLFSYILYFGLQSISMGGWVV